MGVLRNAQGLGLSPRTVIDVGAACGSFSRHCHTLLPDAKYLLIEPLEEYAPALKRTQAAIADAACVRAAALGESGSISIHVHRDLYGSSVYAEREESDVNGTPRVVEAVTIDEVVRRQQASGPFLLKIDAQGAELDALAGARVILPETDLVLLEVSLFAFFDGGPHFCDVIGFMKDAGFVPYDVFEFQYRPLDNALSQMDIAFVREHGKFRGDHHYAGSDQREQQTELIRTHLAQREGIIVA